MKRLHIALSTDDIEATVADYSKRLDTSPCLHLPGQYALWRTDCLNVSVRHDISSPCGGLRHLGWEDPSATGFSQEADVNGIVWEQFSALQQADEINELWPEAKYQPQG